VLVQLQVLQGRRLQAQVLQGRRLQVQERPVQVLWQPQKVEPVRLREQ
jgi:hypothetical protein